jgi:Spy/CpxP family protein refolding chaperone
MIYYKRRKDIMKKIFSYILIATVIGFCFGTSVLAADTSNQSSIMYKQQSKEARRKEFEQRLNLTDKQKEKAKTIHQQGREQMKPIMMKIEVKRQEIETVKLTRISEKMQKEKIDALNSEIAELEKQAQEIRKKNTQEFEKILTKKQKAELETMKAEGRAQFERYHQARPPFQGLGAPSIFSKPLFAPNPSDSLWK